MPLDTYAKFCEQGFSEPFFRGNGTPQGPYLVTFCLAGEHLGYGCGAIASLITLSTFLNRLVLPLLAAPVRSELRPHLSGGPFRTAFPPSGPAAATDLPGLPPRPGRWPGG